MLEEKIDELIIALNENTAALLCPPIVIEGNALKPSIDDRIANIGKMEQEMDDDATAETPKKVAKKKAAKKKAKKVEPATAQQSETTETLAQTPLDATKVQAHIRGIASQLTDTSKLFALIQKHGAQQFSDLDPACYPALIADAEQLVVDGA